MAESHVLDGELPQETAGQVLCRARETAGLSRTQVAEYTKIPERHLLAIEQDNFAALPARTYAVGFSRNYARALGLDEEKITRLVRADLDGASSELAPRAATFEPGDPARIPSSAFAWLAAILAIGVIAAGFIFWRTYYSPASTLPPIAAEAPQPAPPPPPSSPSPASAGLVVFTALEPGVWVKVYDARGQLLQKELAQGESYTVPPEADNPMIWTARPQALAITINGKPVAKLAETRRTIKDVPVSASALLARPAANAPPAPRQSAPMTNPAASPVSPTAARVSPSPDPVSSEGSAVSQ